DIDGRDEQVVALPAVMRARLGVRDGALQHLLDVTGGGAVHEGEDRARLGHAAPADVVRDEPGLAGRDPHVLRGRAAVRPGARHRFTCVFESPAWPRKCRVGANSPSLCPTMSSVMKTGTCLRPSWTAIVWLTIFGEIVDARDQVRIICFLPDSFIASI